jgi:midasin
MQPMDFYLNPRNDVLPIDSPAHLLLQALDLNVALYLHVESLKSIVLDVNPEHAYTNIRALKELDAVVETVQTLGAITLKNMDAPEWTSKTVRAGDHSTLRPLICRQVSINLALRTLRYAAHLRKARGNTHFDYSAVQAISGWLTDALEDCPSDFLPLAQHAKALRETVVLSTGLGMGEIWSKFMAETIPDLPSALTVLDDLARRLGDTPGHQGHFTLLVKMYLISSVGLRRQCFDLMCLKPLDVSASAEDLAAFNRLHDDLLKVLCH